MSVITTTSTDTYRTNPSYQLGMDIGGSKTQLLLGRRDLIIADLRGPSANPASVGWDETARRLRGLLTRLSHDHDVDLAVIDAVCVGAAGIDTPAQADRLAALVAGELPQAGIRVVHDTALLLAASGVESGIALISGTGSVAWGRTPEGREARAGGWGYALGDDGSGYGIAREAVRHALRRLDVGLAPDALSIGLVEACGHDRPSQLLDHFYARAERRYWAERSRVVIDLAVAGDPAATDIVVAGVTALAELVEQISLRLALAGPVILAGGVLVNQPLVRRLLAARLATIGITDLRVLDVDPALGAVRLAQALASTSL